MKGQRKQALDAATSWSGWAEISSHRSPQPSLTSAFQHHHPEQSFGASYLWGHLLKVLPEV